MRLSDMSLRQINNQIRRVAAKIESENVSPEAAREDAIYDVVYHAVYEDIKDHYGNDAIGYDAARDLANGVANEWLHHQESDFGKKLQSWRETAMHIKTYKYEDDKDIDYNAPTHHIIETSGPRKGVYSDLETREVYPSDRKERNRRTMLVLKDKFAEHYGIDENDPRFDRISLPAYEQGMPFHVAEEEFYRNIDPYTRQKMWEESKRQSEERMRREYDDSNIPSGPIGISDINHTQEMLDADLDKDGIPNIIDPDDDNDGISDLIDTDNSLEGAFERQRKENEKIVDDLDKSDSTGRLDSASDILGLPWVVDSDDLKYTMIEEAVWPEPMDDSKDKMYRQSKSNSEPEAVMPPSLVSPSFGGKKRPKPPGFMPRMPGQRRRRG